MSVKVFSNVNCKMLSNCNLAPWYTSSRGRHSAVDAKTQMHNSSLSYAWEIREVFTFNLF